MKTSFLTLLLTLAAFSWACSQSPRVTTDGKNISIAYGNHPKETVFYLDLRGLRALKNMGKYGEPARMPPPKSPLKKTDSLLEKV